MNILLTFDSGYAPHASVVMESIIRHCPEKLDFWILYVHLDTDIIRKMKEHYKDMVQSINFIYVDSEEFTPFKEYRPYLIYLILKVCFYVCSVIEYLVMIGYFIWIVMYWLCKISEI